MEDLWFEEELEPTETSIEDVVKSMPSMDRNVKSQIKSQSRGILRVSQPRWLQLKKEENSFLISSTKDVNYYLVRLGFEFDINPEADKNGVRFVEARCSARLYPPQPHQAQPTVYEVIPRDYYEDLSSKDQKSTIGIKLSPTIQLGPIQMSFGELSKDIFLGKVEPDITGWAGDNECEPYWELRPKSGDLKGQKHLWLIVEVPLDIKGILLAVQVQGTLQSQIFGFLPIGPRILEWEKRNKILLV